MNSPPGSALHVQHAKGIIFDRDGLVFRTLFISCCGYRKCRTDRLIQKILHQVNFMNAQIEKRTIG